MSNAWQKLTLTQKTTWVLGLLLVVAGAWLYMGGHSRYGLFDVDEAIFTEATLEMRQSTVTHGALGLAMPTYNGEPRYHKPPLIYWTQDMAMSALGENSLLAARLPSALSALATLLILGWWVFTLTGNRAWALVSTAVMAFNLSFLVIGRAATADGLLNVSSLALVAWTTYVLLKPTAPWVKQAGWLVTGILAAFGMLAKGPIAWFPAIFVVGTLLIGHKNKRWVWETMAPGKAFLVMLVALAPWLVLLVQQHGLGFFYEFIMVHNIGRYASGLTNTQSSSPFYYVLVLLFGFFPWVLLAPTAIWAALKPLYKKGKKPFKPLKTLLANPKAEKVLPFLAVVWAVLYIVFFSFSKTKLAHYIVPAYPALAVLIGWFWTVYLPSQKEGKRSLGVITTLCGLFMMLLIGSLFDLINPTLMDLRDATLHGWLGWLQVALSFPWPPKDMLATAVLFQHIDLDPAPYIVALLMFLGLIPAWWLLYTSRKEGDYTLDLSFAFVWATCLGLIIWGLVPTVWGYTQAPLARFAVVEANAPASIPLIHLGMHKPSVMYLSGRPFLKLEKALQLPDALHAPETWVLTPITKVAGIHAELEARGGAAVLAHTCDGGYCLLTVARLAK